jgi:hypothetical protein
MDCRSRWPRLTVTFFVSPDNGFIGGHNYFGKGIRASLTDGDAVIYRTIDSGAKWARSNLGKGVVEQITGVDGQVVAQVRVHT